MIFPAPGSTPSHRTVLTAPKPGAGVMLTSTAVGFCYSAEQSGSSFDHAWRPFAQAKAVTFNLGTVQSLAGDGPLEPKIADKPMSGKDGKSPERLLLDPSVANADGVSFVVLEVHPNDKGELTKESKIELVHSLETISRTADVGRKAIAQITWKQRAVARIRPLVHFHLVYVRIVPTSGGGLPRHNFL